ncbi:MAG: GNAT family N-acetyltransferase [Muribaculaceae bacterium]|nr:GNAT family N-acetyltransferase [Muribaculaceae bacterium]
MEIRSLENIDFESLFEGFSNAFSDYEIHFDKSEVQSMLTRRGYTPRLSFAAFDKGKIVAFTLNGVGHFNGIPTAYDTGTGTIKDYRGRGIAAEIFRHSLPYLKEAGIRQYLLEVLQNNHKAITVYRRMQFETTREFDCFRQSIADIDNLPTIKNCTPPAIESISTETVRQAQAFCDFYPSWQNCIESIERGQSELTCIGAFYSKQLVGYSVFDRNTGDLTQIAVKNEHRRKGIASLLLSEVIRRMNTDFVKVINVPSDNLSLPAFLNSKNIRLMNKQFEMTRELRRSQLS